MLWKCCTQYASKFGKPSSVHRTGKCVLIPIPKKGNPKECSNYHTVALISHASNVQNSPSQASNMKPVFELWTSRCSSQIRKGRGTRDHIANILWMIKNAREFQKNIHFCFIDYVKAFDCVDHNKLENSERDGNTRPPDLPTFMKCVFHNMLANLENSAVATGLEKVSFHSNP